MDGEHLRMLIQQRKDEGWSYRRIAKQSGGTIGHTFVQKLATRPRKRAPRTEDLIGLAHGLQMPEEQIFDAANKDWTTAPQLIKSEADDGSILIIASRYKELSEQDRRTIQDLTDTLYRRMKEDERRRANG
jgi:transcriptional regulator with XRE-family HTH domain